MDISVVRALSQFLSVFGVPWVIQSDTLCGILCLSPIHLLDYVNGFRHMWLGPWLGAGWGTLSLK